MAALAASLPLQAKPRPAKGSAKIQLVRLSVWSSAGPGNGENPFTVTVGGTAAHVASVLDPGEELLLVVVLDLVDDIALVEPARSALIDELSKLPPNTYVALLRAQDGMNVLVDPTNDREALKAAILKLTVSGRAGLFEALEPVGDLADSILAKANVRTAILYVTDSDIRNYRDDYTNPVINSSDSRDLSRKFPEGLVQEKINKLDNKMAGVLTPMFILHLNYRTDRLNEAYQTGLKRLAATTGGDSLFCRTIAEIPQGMRQMFASILSLHTLTIDAKTSGERTADVVVQREGTASGDLRYRPRLVLR